MAIIAKALTGVQKTGKTIYAIVAQIIAGLILVTNDGTLIGAVTTNEWLVIAGATLAAGGGVYGLTNK